VTVIATGFGGRRRTRRETRADLPTAPAEAPTPDFRVGDDVLDVPSFLRDDS
jgi:hypothetical protein